MKKFLMSVLVAGMVVVGASSAFANAIFHNVFVLQASGNEQIINSFVDHFEKEGAKLFKKDIDFSAAVTYVEGNPKVGKYEYRVYVPNLLTGIDTEAVNKELRENDWMVLSTIITPHDTPILIVCRKTSWF